MTTDNLGKLKICLINAILLMSFIPKIFVTARLIQLSSLHLEPLYYEQLILCSKISLNLH